MEGNVVSIKRGIMINVDVSVKKHHICEKDYIWNPATCSCENGKYLASIIDDSVSTYDGIIEKKVPTNVNEKSNLSNTKFLYFTCNFINYYSIIDSC